MAQQYMFLIYGDANALGDVPPTPEMWTEMMEAHGKFAQDVTSSGGRIVSGEALAPTSAATTVRPQDGGADAIVTDGPFAETREALGGYYLIECADLDQALGFAKILPTGGCVEVRPVIDTRGGQ